MHGAITCMGDHVHGRSRAWAITCMGDHVHGRSHARFKCMVRSGTCDNTYCDVHMTIMHGAITCMGDMHVHGTSVRTICMRIT